MSEKVNEPQDQMMQWITSKWIIKPLGVIVELGIADLLREGPLSAEVLAKKCGAHGPTLYRLLRALASVGIFQETEGEVFGLTSLGRCLLADALGPIARMFLSHWHDAAWNSLEYSLRTGKSGFEHAFGKPAFQWLEENPRARAVMDQAQGVKAAGFARAVLAAYDFSFCQTICDVGGGQGAFLIQLLKKYRHLNGMVADMPGAVRSAQKAAVAAGLSTRCQVVACDFFRELPPACDGYFLVNVLHDWEDEPCRRILKNIAGAMNSNAKLWVVEYLLDSAPGFSVARLLDLEVLIMGGGRERARDEYSSLFGSAGLGLSRVISTDRGPAIMECTAA